MGDSGDPGGLRPSDAGQIDELTQTIMNLVRARINEGLSLAQALAEQPRSFSSDYIASISAGEQSGQLATVLLRLASYTQQLQATHKRIQLALIDPAMILLVAVERKTKVMARSTKLTAMK